VKEQADLSRDVIKSDTAEVIIPELDLHITTGSLGGLITTVEGLATSVQVPLRC
jgi:zinc finger protein